MDANPSERVRKLAEEGLRHLSAELEAGRSEALENYLAAMARFHRYSWGNVLLITSQRPNATRVAGYHTWHDLGRFVKKGEKGIMIFAPMIVKRQDPSAAVNESKPDQVFRLSGFRADYVFDIEQTEGRPLPPFASVTGDCKDCGEKLKEIIARRGISLEYDKSIAPASGISSGGRIRILPDLSAAEEFSVLAHELAHEMLHHRKDQPRLPKTVGETQAEAVAFVVCRAAGLQTNRAAADYITLYSGDPKTLAESLSVIQKASSEILDELLPDERVPPVQQQTSISSTPDAPLTDRAPQPPEAPQWVR